MSASSLKFIMLGLMVLDHIGPFISGELAAFFHILSRPVAPVFAYMAVEGFLHTGNRKAYIKRLGLAALIMALGNLLINRYIIDNPVYYVGNSIFASLFLGLLALSILEEIKRKDKKSLFILIFLIFIISLFTEGGVFVVSFMMISYLLRGDIRKRNIIFIIMTLLMLPSAIVDYGNLRDSLIMFFVNSDILFFVAGLPFIGLYNGERGKNSKFVKYLFYIFYPTHLWIIGIMADKLI